MVLKVLTVEKLMPETVLASEELARKEEVRHAVGDLVKLEVCSTLQKAVLYATCASAA